MSTSFSTHLDSSHTIWSWVKQTQNFQHAINGLSNTCWPWVKQSQIWNIQTVGSMKITFIFTVGWFTQQQTLLKMYNLSALKTLHAPVWIIPNHINFLPCLLHINYSSSLHPSFTWSHIHCNQYNYAFVPFVFHFRKLEILDFCIWF